MTQLRVYLADDHAVVREGLKVLINAQAGMRVVGEAADGLTACQEKSPASILMSSSWMYRCPG